MTIKIVRLGYPAPTCEAEVYQPWLAKRQIRRCALRASYAVDGVKLCHAHAGRVVLHALAEKGEEPVACP